MFCCYKKGVYPYEDMDNWEKFDEITLPPKEVFYSNLSLENISDEDYEHAQKVWNVFEIKNRGKYHDLYAQSDTLLLANVYVSSNIWTWSRLFCVCTRISIASLLKKDRNKIRNNNRLWHATDDWKGD